MVRNKDTVFTQGKKITAQYLRDQIQNAVSTALVAVYD